MIKGHLLPRSGIYKIDISTFFYLYKVTNLDVGQIVALKLVSLIFETNFISLLGDSKIHFSYYCSYHSTAIPFFNRAAAVRRNLGF